MFDLPTSVLTQCAVCRGWSTQRLCADCLQRHAAPRARCGGCALPMPQLAAGVTRCGACITAPLPFAHAVAAVDYAFPWSGLVTALSGQSARAGEAE